MDSPVGSNMDSIERKRAETLKSFLNPIEPLVMKVQSLIVWERPVKSAILFLFVHVVFWFFAVCGCQVYFWISISLILTYFLRTWKRKIWPEIRVPPKEPEDPDSWTPVHPRLLSVPEICKYLAQIWCSLSRFVNSCMLFRQNHRFLFCVVSSCFFLSLAVLGRFISGVIILYISVISIMLWPCVLYHNLLQKLYLKFEPIFMKLDYSLKLKSKWSFKGSKSRSGSKGQGEDTGTTDTDSDDFCPSLDPVATAILARSITDSEDESNGTPSVNTPMLSKEHSFSEDDHDEDFTPDLGELPSIGHLDDTDDEILAPPIPRLKNSDTNSNGHDSIQFHPSHFGDTSESEDEYYTRDLRFPDINDIQSPEPSKKTENKQREEIQQQEAAGMALLASSLVTQTFSTMMQSAMSGLTKMAASPNRSDQSEQVLYKKDDESIQSASGNQGSLATKNMSDSDVDIAEEFEFLDEYDIEDEKHDDEKS